VIKLLPISKLLPHPDNPRLFLREEVVNAICEQIKAKGGDFEERHAPHVRTFNGAYQIISGHQRTKGAEKAGLAKIPCIVVEMTDEEAFRELLLSNAQDDLKPLEIGLHVLKAVERGKGGRGKKGGVREYARQMGANEQTMMDWAHAAAVAKLHDQPCSLLSYTTSLSIIHRAPESDWPVLVTAMLKGWSKETTEDRVETVKQFEIPEDLAEVYPRDRVIARYLDGFEFAPATLAKLIDAIRRTETSIATYGNSVNIDSHTAQFRAWLVTDNNAWDLRRINRRSREIFVELDAAEIEASRRWNLGDWRESIAALADGSVALLLTDPPYGIDFQSDFRLDRTKPHRHEKIEHDGTIAEAELHECLRAFHPKLTENAHVLCFCHWRQEPAFRTALECAGYQLRGSLIWLKNNTGMGDPNTTFAPKHERILHAVKGSPLLFRREADVIEAARIESDQHPTEKPVALLSRLIETLTVEGELVADPFGGVASTLVAAKKLGRAYWGCEINAEYHARGGIRLVQEKS
jgi:DNA modification methylase